MSEKEKKIMEYEKKIAERNSLYSVRKMLEDLIHKKDCEIDIASKAMLNEKN